VTGADSRTIRNIAKELDKLVELSDIRIALRATEAEFAEINRRAVLRLPRSPLTVLPRVEGAKADSLLKAGIASVQALWEAAKTKGLAAVSEATSIPEKEL